MTDPGGPLNPSDDPDAPLPAYPGDDVFWPDSGPTRRRPRRHQQPAQDRRLPPHNLAAEEALIGALLLDAARVVPEVTEAGVAASDHYAPAHQHIHAAVLALVARRDPVDAVTVSEELRQTGLLGEVGGLERLADLQNATPSLSNVATYAATVRDTALLRRIIRHAADVQDAAFKATRPLEAIEAADRMLAEIQTAVDLRQVSALDVADYDAMLEVGLRAPEPEIGHRQDGAGLFYLGAVNQLQAEPSAGKTWIALVTAVEVLAAGGAVVMIDNDDTKWATYARMLALGAPGDAMRTRFRYLKPSGPMGVAELAELNQIMDDLNPDLVIIDGVGDALAMEGLSEDKASEFLVWANKIPRPLARTGACVILIDHLVKDKEQQGRYARGSGAKLAMIDGAAYSVRAVVPFSRSKAGSSRMTIAKDKPGGVGAIGDHAAVFHLEPHADGERVVCQLVKPPDDQDPDVPDWQPTHTMARIMRELGDAGPTPASTLRKLIPGTHKPRTVTRAIQSLIASGHIQEQRDGRRTVLVPMRPYTAPDARSGRDEPPPPDDEAPPSLFLVDDIDLDGILGPPVWETHPDQFHD